MRSFHLRILFHALVICCMGAACHTVSAQDLPPLSSEYARGTIPTGGQSLPFGMFRTITGKPFQAEYNSRRLMPGPDTMRVQEFHDIFARDSQGRILRETVYPHSDDVKATGRQGDHFFEVLDSATHENISWDDGPGKIVTKMAARGGIPANAPLSPCAGGHTGTLTPPRVRGQSTRADDLGEQKIDGITVHGCRITNLVTESGNPDFPVPYSLVDETWVSPELGVAVLHMHTDRDTVDLIERLDNIVLGEPDAAMFNPPENFRVYDQEADMAKARDVAKTREIPLGQDDPSPILLGGPWEAADPIVLGARVGIHLYLDARRDVQLSGRMIASRGPGTYIQFSGAFFQRANGNAAEEGFVVFAPGVESPFEGLTWDGQRLKGTFKPHGRGLMNFPDPEFGIDLTFDRAQQVWVGQYTRRGVTKQIRLERPGASAAADPFAGIWAGPMIVESARPMEPAGGCVEISRSIDGTYTAWTAGEGALFPSEAPRPTTGLSNVSAGFKLGITVRDGTITLDPTISQYEGGEMPKYVGHLSPEGNQIELGEATVVSEDGQATRQPLALMRISIDACYARRADPAPGRAIWGR